MFHPIFGGPGRNNCHPNSFAHVPVGGACHRPFGARYVTREPVGPSFCPRPYFGGMPYSTYNPVYYPRTYHASPGSTLTAGIALAAATIGLALLR